MEVIYMSNNTLPNQMDTFETMSMSSILENETEHS